MKVILNTFHGFLDILYPRHCFVCNKGLYEEDSVYTCKECWAGIETICSKRCVRCGFELGPGMAGHIKGCPECKNVSLKFERSFFVSDYKWPLKDLIHQFKYNKHECLAKPLGNLLVNHLQNYDIISEIDIVLPVPLHWKRKFKRGFNQSELLVKRICKELSLPISVSNLCRTKNTMSQTLLSRSQRMKNVLGAFNVKKPKIFSKKQVLLVDDVMTTGVTASECAKYLKKAGAKRVYFLALARAAI